MLLTHSICLTEQLIIFDLKVRALVSTQGVIKEKAWHRSTSNNKSEVVYTIPCSSLATGAKKKKMVLLIRWVHALSVLHICTNDILW